MTFWMRPSSASLPTWLLLTLMARFARHATTPDFTDMGWCELNGTQRFVCVGFWYTSLVSSPWGWRVILISMKGREPLFSISMVNWIRPCCLFRCWSSPWTLCFFTTEMTSSTKLYHTRGVASYVPKVLSSRCSMKISNSRTILVSTWRSLAKLSIPNKASIHNDTR